jgi:UPF0176 protein
VALAAQVRTLGQRLGLLGSVVVAPEGLGGAVAGPPGPLASFETALTQPDVLGAALHGMPFKRSECRTPPFGRWKVAVKPEIVALGLPGKALLPPPDEADASHLDPAGWRALLDRDDVVLLDNRNHFEYRLGHFRGAVDPRVHNFRDFVAYVEDQAPAWRAAGRPVAMYCTGGVRCDKTAPWLRSLGLTVWQLQGGVLGYFQQQADADRDWQGECFVFDRRVALDSRLHETTTTAEQVFDPTHPDEAWRLKRALELEAPHPPATPDGPA